MRGRLLLVRFLLAASLIVVGALDLATVSSTESMASASQSSQRDGDSKTPYARVQDIGRVRVAVK